MGILMFIIFLINDLFTVLICQFTIGDLCQVRDGMIFGVHVPQESRSHPQVEELCTRYAGQWKRFSRINIFCSIAVCFLCFWNFMVFILVWLVWLILYIAGLYYYQIVPRRRMYQLKLQQHWINEAKAHVVSIDTAVSALGEKLAAGSRWHLAMLLVTGISGGLLLWRTNYFQTDALGNMLFWITVLLTLMFFLLHVLVLRLRNTVYSEQTSVNLAVNRVVKQAWAHGLLYGDGLNTTSWCYLALQAALHGETSEADFWIYMGFQMLTVVALLIPVLSSRHKKQEILERDTAPMLVDDDEYWKNGWYENPSDRHILVPDRFLSCNYQINVGRPAGKAIVGVTTAVLLGTLIWTCWLIIPMFHVEVSVSYTEQSATVAGAGYSCTFDYEDMEELELIDAMPDVRYSRKNGLGTEENSIGRYSSREAGDAMLFLYRKSTPIIHITLPDQNVYLNTIDPEQTRAWYQELMQYTKAAQSR